MSNYESPVSDAEMRSVLRVGDERGFRALIAKAEAAAYARGRDDALTVLTARAMDWSRRHGHSFDPLHVSAKVCEEAGEVIGEAIKRTENRQDGIDRAERLRDELADLGIVWLKLCAIEGHDPVQIMAQRCEFNESRTPLRSDQ